MAKNPDGGDDRKVVGLMTRLLNPLPEPRMISLKPLSPVIAREAFPTQAQTAALLGVSPRAFTYLKQRKAQPAGHLTY